VGTRADSGEVVREEWRIDADLGGLKSGLDALEGGFRAEKELI
jgi:hypothetical protein